MTRPLFHTTELPNAAVIDTYTYSTSAFVPTKTHKVRKIDSYNDLQKLAKNALLFIFFFFFFFFFS